MTRIVRPGAPVIMSAKLAKAPAGAAGRARAGGTSTAPAPSRAAKGAGREPPAPRVGPDFAREAALMRRGLMPVAGVDEAGRGPLAGPVVAAAVVLDPDRIPEGLDDSKLIPAARRDELFDAIVATADVAVASVSAARIDVIDIRQATLEAMRRAVRALCRPPAFILVDGRDLPGWDGPGEAVVKGDRLVASIAAASIVAKVTRDRMMSRLGSHYPAYGFERHAGYATAAHRQAILAQGPCPFHRMTFGMLDVEIDNEE